jgi:hypothetical protein
MCKGMGTFITDGSTKNFVVEKPHGIMLSGKPGSKWKYVFKVDSRLTGYKCMDWIKLARYKAYFWAALNTGIKLWQHGHY